MPSNVGNVSQRRETQERFDSIVEEGGQFAEGRAILPGLMLNKHETVPTAGQAVGERWIRAAKLTTLPRHFRLRDISQAFFIIWRKREWYLVC